MLAKSKKILITALAVLGLSPMTQALASSDLDTPTDIVMQELFASQDDIVGVDVHVAGGYEDGPIFSRWGHAFLVFVNKNEKHYYNNIAISLVADIPIAKNPEEQDGMLEMYGKGLFGGYSLTFDGDYFYYFWDRYVLNESRPLERLAIPMNDEIRAKFFDNLRKGYKDPSRLGSYKFITNNCIVAVSNLLKDSGIPLESSPLIPLNAKKHYKNSAVTTAPDEKVGSSTKNLPKLVEDIQEREIKTYGEFTKELINELAQKYGAGALLKFVSSDRYLYFHFGKYISETFALELQSDSMAKSFTAYEQMYELCGNQTCARDLLLLEEEVYSNEVFAANNFQRHSLSAGASEENAYSKHMKLMVDAAKPMSATMTLSGIKAKNGLKFEFTPKAYDQEKGLLSLDIIKVKKGKTTTANYLRALIPMEVTGTSAGFEGKECVDLATMEFKNNCGVIIENGKAKLTAY